MEKVLHQPVYRSLRERAAGRSAVRCSFPSAFTIAPDRFLPTTILFENQRFYDRFAPAEGVIYVTMPGYTDDYNGALIVTDMYFSIWETSALYFTQRSSDGEWKVVWKRVFLEQGE